jgi:membrane protein YdbS with pleckstrin-like domain
MLELLGEVISFFTSYAHKTDAESATVSELRKNAAKAKRAGFVSAFCALLSVFILAYDLWMSGWNMSKESVHLGALAILFSLIFFWFLHVSEVYRSEKYKRKVKERRVRHERPS